MRTQRWLDVALVILSLITLGLTGTVVARLLRSPTIVTEAGHAPVPQWQDYGRAGHREGPEAAIVTVVMFSDFQCAYCRQTEADLARLRTSRPNDVAVVYRHYPLESIHPHSRLAAVASECAANQGRFGAYRHQLFRLQDSIGVISWVDFARRSDVRDLNLFELCMLDGRATERVVSDIAAGNRLGVVATPTLLVNDRRIRGAPTLALLDSVVQDVLRSERDS